MSTVATERGADPWVFRQDLASEARVRHEFRAWVRQTLAPRYRPDA